MQAYLNFRKDLSCYSRHTLRPIGKKKKKKKKFTFNFQMGQLKMSKIWVLQGVEVQRGSLFGPKVHFEGSAPPQ